MSESSHPFAFSDYFRVPYAVRPALAVGGHLLTPLSVRRLHPAGQAGRWPLARGGRNALLRGYYLTAAGRWWR